MKNRFLILVFIFSFVSITFISFFDELKGNPVSEAAQFKYIGAEKCAGSCHKGDAKGRQYEIWQESNHSKAYFTLKTPKADSIALSRGYTTPAVETPQCLKCHVLGKEIDPAELEPTFDITQGIQCETCHGPGSEYKKLSIMKDREKAKENGMIVYENNIDEFCRKCHNSESPSTKVYNFEEYWAKIQHPKPKE